MHNLVFDRHIAASSATSQAATATGNRGSVLLRPFDLQAFVQIVQSAQASFPLSEAHGEIDLSGRWFSYVPSLHRALATHLSLNRPHLKVAWNVDGMQADDHLYEQLGHARQAALELLRLIEAEQEQVKGRMVDRSGQIIDATEKRLADAETPADVARSLRNTFREPSAILEGNQSARKEKGRATQLVNAQVATLSDENRRLRLERKVLKGEQLTLDDLHGEPGAGRARRRRGR